MIEYIHLYDNSINFENDYNSENYNEPWVSVTKDIAMVDYNKSDTSIVD